MKKEKIIKSSGNVFADLGFENADEMLTKAQLAFLINQRIGKKRLMQEATTSILGIPLDAIKGKKP